MKGVEKLNTESALVEHYRVLRELTVYLLPNP